MSLPGIPSNRPKTETSETPSPPNRGTLWSLGVIFAVAVLVATLFTAITPGQFRDEQSAENQEKPESSNSNPTPTLAPDQPSPTPETEPRIGIVAGHWGNDPGAVCSDGLKEVDINQNIATLVQKYLVEEGYRVDLLQEFDSKLEDYKAIALVSIHADSCDYINDQASGYKVAAAMASQHPERSARLTACLRSRYAQYSGMTLHSTSVTRDMTSYHAFEEIHEVTPAAIIETGFMNLDRQFLTMKPEVAAQGITAGILCYVRNESITPETPTIDQ
jgi:N-acetylmuramoyl-L-alanine amidase